jgi:hypothetical protein
MFNFALIHWCDEGAAPYKGRGCTRTQQECECGPAAGVPGTGAPRNFILNGHCHEIFDFRFFFWNQFPPKPLSIPLGPFQIVSKIHGGIRSSRCTTSVVDTGGKRKKSSIRKVLNIFFGKLWVVE